MFSSQINKLIQFVRGNEVMKSLKLNLSSSILMIEKIESHNLL